MWLVCVKNSSSQGDHFYNGGLFQQLIREIQEETEHPYQVVQNDDSVTLVIKNMGSVDKAQILDRKSTRLNSSHVAISYAVFCLKKKKKKNYHIYNKKSHIQQKITIHAR